MLYYVILADGTKVHAPLPSKSMLMMDEFLRLARLPGSTLYVYDVEPIYEKIAARLPLTK
jgi:hypothetical protein